MHKDSLENAHRSLPKINERVGRFFGADKKLIFKCFKGYGYAHSTIINKHIYLLWLNKHNHTL
jgi:hypothetical protein